MPLVLDVDAFAIKNMYGVNYEHFRSDEIVEGVKIGSSVKNIKALHPYSLARHLEWRTWLLRSDTARIGSVV